MGCDQTKIPVTNIYRAVFVILICTAISIAAAQEWVFSDTSEVLELNDVCKFRHNSSMGICLPISSCPAAASEFRQSKIHPTMCSLESKNPIVCCWNGGKLTDNSVATENPMTTPSGLTLTFGQNEHVKSFYRKCIASI